MTPLEQEIPAEALPERQRAFLTKLRNHDKRVKIVRDGSKLKFHGPVIGEGLVPDDEPTIGVPGDDS